MLRSLRRQVCTTVRTRSTKRQPTRMLQPKLRRRHSTARRTRRSMKCSSFPALTKSWESQQNGCIKTTIVLPDALVKQVKLRAVREGRKLKEAVADLLRKGLAVAV